MTAVGTLNTLARRSPLGPCDKIGSSLFGFGHLGWAPAELVVRHIVALEIRENPKSLYDYSRMYEGPL
jgi:hypothetical protein